MAVFDVYSVERRAHTDVALIRLCAGCVQAEQMIVVGETNPLTIGTKDMHVRSASQGAGSEGRNNIPSVEIALPATVLMMIEIDQHDLGRPTRKLSETVLGRKFLVFSGKTFRLTTLLRGLNESAVKQLDSRTNYVSDLGQLRLLVG